MQRGGQQTARPGLIQYKVRPEVKQWIEAEAKGKSLSESYRAAYKASKMKPETVNDSASKLMANPAITHRVRQLQAAAADRAELEVTQVLRELKREILILVSGYSVTMRARMPASSNAGSSRKPSGQE